MFASRLLHLVNGV